MNETNPKENPSSIRYFCGRKNFVNYFLIYSEYGRLVTCSSDEIRFFDLKTQSLEKTLRYYHNSRINHLIKWKKGIFLSAADDGRINSFSARKMIRGRVIFHRYTTYIKRILKLDSDRILVASRSYGLDLSDEGDYSIYIIKYSERNPQQPNSVSFAKILRKLCSPYRIRNLHLSRRYTDGFGDNLKFVKSRIYSTCVYVNFVNAMGERGRRLLHPLIEAPIKRINYDLGIVDKSFNMTLDCANSFDVILNSKQEEILISVGQKKQIYLFNVSRNTQVSIIVLSLSKTIDCLRAHFFLSSYYIFMLDSTGSFYTLEVDLEDINQSSTSPEVIVKVVPKSDNNCMKKHFEIFQEEGSAYRSLAACREKNGVVSIEELAQFPVFETEDMNERIEFLKNITFEYDNEIYVTQISFLCLEKKKINVPMIFRNSTLKN